MIRPNDFAIEIGGNQNGTFVRVSHKYTGTTRLAEGVPERDVGHVRDRFLDELRYEICHEEDFTCVAGCSSHGDFISVVHLPSGLRRTALRRESVSELELMADILDEIHRRQARPK